MKTKWSIVMALALLAALAVPLSVAAGGDKVTLCHKPNTPDEVTITVSVNALDAHLAHGDYQGVCTQVRVLTCPFDATAIPVIGPDPVKYVIDFPAPPSEYGWDAVFWSSTGQYYLWAAVPLGVPPPPPDWFAQFPGDQFHTGWPGEPSVFDIYVAKVNPEDADFDHMVECVGAEILPPP